MIVHSSIDIYYWNISTLLTIVWHGLIIKNFKNIKLITFWLLKMLLVAFNVFSKSETQHWLMWWILSPWWQCITMCFTMCFTMSVSVYCMCLSVSPHVFHSVWKFQGNATDLSVLLSSDQYTLCTVWSDIILCWNEPLNWRPEYRQPMITSQWLQYNPI